MWYLRPPMNTNSPIIVYNKVFDDEDISYLEDYVANYQKFEDGKTGNTSVAGKTSDYRKSKISWLMPNDENLRFVFERVAASVEQVNRDYFRMSITSFDSLQYTTYDETDEGHYEWHMDQADLFNEKNWSRKLSVVSVLNEGFEGGVFEVNISGKAEQIDIKKGDMVFFPSFILHRVTPVTKGMRKSLVAWVDGPTFV